MLSILWPEQVPLNAHLLGRLQHRRYRDQTGLYVVEDVRMVAAAVQAGAPIEVLVTCADLMASPRARDLAESLSRRGIPRLEVPPETFRALSRRDGPQGIGAVVRQRWEPFDHLVLPRRPRGWRCTPLAIPATSA